MLCRHCRSVTYSFGLSLKNSHFNNLYMVQKSEISLLGELMIRELCLKMIWRIFLFHFSEDLNYSWIGFCNPLFTKFLNFQNIYEIKVTNAIVEFYHNETFERYSLILWILLTFSEEIFFKKLERIAAKLEENWNKILCKRCIILYSNWDFSRFVKTFGSFSICHCDFLHGWNSDKCFGLQNDTNYTLNLKSILFLPCLTKCWWRTVGEAMSSRVRLIWQMATNCSPSSIRFRQACCWHHVHHLCLNWVSIS